MDSDGEDLLWLHVGIAVNGERHGYRFQSKSQFCLDVQFLGCLLISFTACSANTPTSTATTRTYARAAGNTCSTSPITNYPL
jgi:hypothetical protein